MRHGNGSEPRPDAAVEVRETAAGASAGDEFAAARPPQLAPVGRANRAEDLANSTRLFLPRALADVIGNINAALQSQAERVTYLGPLRSFPPRHLAFAEGDEPNWFAGGGYAWNVVRTNEEVRNAVNRWLGSEGLQTKYQLRIRSLAPMGCAGAAIRRRNRGDANRTDHGGRAAFGGF